MKLLLAVTFYRPHLSGLTLSVVRLAEGLAGRGHEVTVLTSRHDPSLPAVETLSGVRVLRLRPSRLIGKAPVLLSHPIAAGRELRRADAVLVNLPATPPESVVLPLAARALRRPLIATYHCEVRLPGRRLGRLLTGAAYAASRACVRLADRVVTLTADFAAASAVLRGVDAKLAIIPPPAALGRPRPDAATAWRAANLGQARVLLAFVGRLATEKGVDVLLRALPLLDRELGGVRVLLVGEHERVLGEQAYRERLAPLLAAAGDAVRVLGVLPDECLPDVYAACDATILPSVNSTEAFGLVQVESMLAGTPVIASDLPGVRVPIRSTGMGVLATPGRPDALAAAIVEVVRNRARYLRPRSEIEQLYSIERTVDAYEELLEELCARSASSARVRLRRENSPAEK